MQPLQLANGGFREENTHYVGRANVEIVLPNLSLGMHYFADSIISMVIPGMLMVISIIHLKEIAQCTMAIKT